VRSRAKQVTTSDETVSCTFNLYVLFYFRHLGHSTTSCLPNAAASPSYAITLPLLYSRARQSTTPNIPPRFIFSLLFRQSIFHYHSRRRLAFHPRHNYFLLMRRCKGNMAGFSIVPAHLQASTTRAINNIYSGTSCHHAPWHGSIK